LAEENGADVVFAPEVNEMYPEGTSTSLVMKNVTAKFEGKTRPTHFNGVATVVAKLFNIVLPDCAVFGQKDYQQTLVVRRMVSDINFPIEIIIAPIVREPDGLAKSSRNIYLSAEERSAAPALRKSILSAKQAIESGERNRLTINEIIARELSAQPLFRLDYGSCASALTLDEPDEFAHGEEVVLLTAAYLGKTRLIDNELAKIK
jgi:pantoate--beta-alanine ligase